MRTAKPHGHGHSDQTWHAFCSFRRDGLLDRGESMMEWPGASDLRDASEQLAARLPVALAPLARIALDYAWSWTPGGEEVFAALDPHRWQLCQRNPVRQLQEVPLNTLRRVATDESLMQRIVAVEAALGARHAYERRDARPVAVLCAEYGVHASLPIYAGGLGVLAGDLLKAASDRSFPMVGVGLLYRKGYFRQQMNASGWQLEYWIDTDPERLPAALVTRGGEPLTVTVPLRGERVVVQIWRVDVGRVPLYLLDADRPENRMLDRWITGRLYVGDHETRLCQYALLGIGAVRALAAMNVEPAVWHLNDGHAVLAPFELTAAEVAAGRSFEEALASVRRRTVFTTHTPVPAGNEAYSAEEFRRVLPDLPGRLGTTWETVLALARTDPANAGEPPSLTPLGLRTSRAANGVSKRHGGIARSMWAKIFPGRAADEVPIGNVTNGVHLPTWMAGPMRDLLDRHLAPGWIGRTTDPMTWDALERIPDAELWQVRRQLRAALVDDARQRAVADRLARGEPLSYVELATHAFDPDRLTIGFARRLATYKRLYLLTVDLPRSLRLLTGEHPVQILLAGKAHPQDDGAKRVVQQIFTAKSLAPIGQHIAYLHDYDMETARSLVAGCDVWVNLPRPPLEASGTSGMKAALNGGINLSVLDGWWAEAYDGENGWAIDGREDADAAAQDHRDAEAVLELLEREVVPAFHERDADGVPRRWLRRVRASIRTAALRFSAARMLDDYVAKVYTPSAS